MGYRRGRRRRRRRRRSLCRPPLTEARRPGGVRTNVRARRQHERERERQDTREERRGSPGRNPLVVCDGGGSSWRKEQMGREIARASARSDRMRLSSGERERDGDRDREKGR